MRLFIQLNDKLLNEKFEWKGGETIEHDGLENRFIYLLNF